MRRFWLWLALLTLFAWLLREYFIAASVVEIPIRGDVRQYVAYAWNMLNHGTFSQSWPGSGTPLPDTFRGPGYPTFLALWMMLSPTEWYMLSLQAQAILGALTVTLAVLLARHWLPNQWALFAGMLLALWPHHIAATGALLTEIVFGFLLVLALLLVAETVKRKRIRWAAASGVVFSLAALTSMVSLLFPFVVASVLWRERLVRMALTVLVFSLLGTGTWSLRNATVPAVEAPGRMAMNLVQGSWPQYHRAYASRNASPIARDIMREIDREERLVASRPRAGLERMLSRMSHDSGYFVYWYLLEKPYLLWDWDIRMGAGDVYFHQVRHSPLESNPVLHAVKRSLELSNPLIFVVSGVASLAFLIGWFLRRPWATATSAAVAGFCIYATVVHMAFQAEPRYSIPYRPMQLLMFASLLWLLIPKKR